MIPITRATNVKLPRYQYINYLCVNSEANNYLDKIPMLSKATDLYLESLQIKKAVFP